MQNAFSADSDAHVCFVSESLLNSLSGRILKEGVNKNNTKICNGVVFVKFSVSEVNYSSNGAQDIFLSRALQHTAL